MICPLPSLMYSMAIVKPYHVIDCVDRDLLRVTPTTTMTFRLIKLRESVKVMDSVVSEIIRVFKVTVFDDFPYCGQNFFRNVFHLLSDYTKLLQKSSLRSGLQRELTVTR